MTNMKQIGWFVVGDGKFGSYLFGSPNDCPPILVNENEIDYWKNRGYEGIPAYVSAEDKEEYTFVGDENETGVNYVR